MSKKYVYFFGGGKADGKAEMKKLLGGKGANLAEMTNLGIPVPPGYTISTEVCNYYQKHHSYPEGLEEELIENLNRLEKISGKKLGDVQNPLLVSVRSGAAISMPGMMDTVLNLGLNDETVKGLVKKTGNQRFSYDAYRRFVQMFGNVVLGIEHSKFEQILEKKKEVKGVKFDTELDADDLKELVEEYKALVKEDKGIDFPSEPHEQLEKGYEAVFNSWNNERARTYRKLHNIPDDLGTAVNVQMMVFGNMGDDSGTGVAFTRNPSTGEKRFYGEYLLNAQGEDVVAGIRTPEHINKLKEKMPAIYQQLEQIYQKLESHYRDMQDMEFTIEKGELFVLQTRTAKRTAQSAVKVAVDMVGEGLISKEEAVMRVQPKQIDQLLHPMIDPQAKIEVIARGLPASPGAAVGKVVFAAKDAQERGKREKVILVRHETSPEDIGGMAAAQGILTARGGMTSHAAVVARGMGKCCIAGCESIVLNEENKSFSVADLQVKEGDYISLNGSTGEVILGKVDLIEPTLSGDFATLMSWADELRKLKVRTNADTPRDAQKALDFGAEGIGLCRTEHMFFAKERISIVREMILAKDKEARLSALQRLLPMQKEDFKGIFKVMQGLPVTIRLLDPPLHEFLPQGKEQIEETAADMGIAARELEEKIQSLREINPMLGHRGCRLGIIYPEITEMQARAIFEAAAELTREGMSITPEIMVPLVSDLAEFKSQKEIIMEVAEKVIEEQKVKLNYLIGTMIEVPRAALTAQEIAREAEFFSFGTNDLTQMTFGFSRDDAGKFLPAYIERGILKQDPFVVIDQEGVGQLVKLGLQRGRSTRHDLKIGICGEHGGEPSSVEFCHRVGLDYVSCSPFRVPIARLAAAQAAIKESSE
ncbi:MAG: pyruvate, phosphate dikinase [Candidatus Omnitrophica bacterium 4484_213]|nr:MAG: pyruvate, phosphate dikinase [Candidatus Omnitrophica bacterium 4484_213]